MFEEQLVYICRLGSPLYGGEIIQTSRRSGLFLEFKDAVGLSVVRL